MGCFYAGFDYKNRKHGYFKIGETEKKTPAARLVRIRHDDCFQCLGYIVMEDESKPQRLFVESYARMKMAERYTHTQNDHFLYDIRQGEKYEQANEMAQEALQYAKEACEIAKISYHVGEKSYKRG